MNVKLEYDTKEDDDIEDYGIESDAVENDGIENDAIEKYLDTSLLSNDSLSPVEMIFVEPKIRRGSKLSSDCFCSLCGKVSLWY